MKNFIVICFLLLSIGLTGCSKKTEEIQIVGQPGLPGLDGISMGVDVSSEAPSCLAGGSTIRTFVDSNRNSQLDLEETIKQVAVVCNGINGQDGQNGIDGTSVTIATASSTQCPNGGVVLNGQTPICNGENGQMGPQGEQGEPGPIGPMGAQGPQGIPGVPGADGAQGLQGSIGPVGPQGPVGPSGGVGNVTPVQLCPGDSSSFKEQGLVIGTDLFAVYFDKNQPIAFLAKLNPGNYVTTNGSNCTFTYSNNGTTATLSNGNGTTTIPLTSSTPTQLTGQCVVSKFADYQSEQQFHFSVTGMTSHSSYTLEVTFNNGNVVNQVQDSNGGASTYVNPLYTIAPQNLSQGFDFYAKHNGNVVNKPTVASAKVKKNSQEMSCSVSN